MAKKIKKKCTSCQVEKYLNYFSSCKGGKHGVSSYCKSCFSRMAREKYQYNKENNIERSKAWRRNNLERSKRYDEKYRAKNPEKRKKWNKQYRIRHADRVRITEARKGRTRREQINKTIDQITPEQWSQIQKKQKGKCYYCSTHPKVMEMDHVVPLKKGGEHSADNIVGCCKSCNSRKQASDTKVWAKKIGRLFL